MQNAECRMQNAKADEKKARYGEKETPKDGNKP
jgi:hypothetical protein